MTTLTQSKTQDVNTLRQVFSNINLYSCPHDYNFHLHTTCSDGRLTPQSVIDQAINIGLKGFAITDHHTLKGYDQAQYYLDILAQSNRNLPDFWSGIEITANLLDVDVHILGYGFNPNHSSLKPYIKGNSPGGKDADCAEVINALHQAGAIVILAHPARYKKSAFDLINAVVKLGIDGVETYYAYSNPNPWQPSLKETEKVKSLADSYGLYNTCGTDTHGVNLLMRL